jgi:protein kinase X
MSANAIDIVKQLLDPNPETRLGCRKSGTAEIKEHPFFNKVINFQLLIREKEEAPVRDIYCTKSLAIIRLVCTIFL